MTGMAGMMMDTTTTEETEIDKVSLSNIGASELLSIMQNGIWAVAA